MTRNKRCQSHTCSRDRWSLPYYPDQHCRCREKWRPARAILRRVALSPGSILAIVQCCTGRIKAASDKKVRSRQYRCREGGRGNEKRKKQCRAIRFQMAVVMGGIDRRLCRFRPLPGRLRPYLESGGEKRFWGTGQTKSVASHSPFSIRTLTGSLERPMPRFRWLVSAVAIRKRGGACVAMAVPCGRTHHHSAVGCERSAGRLQRRHPRR
jgi:hypothetical protein